MAQISRRPLSPEKLDKIYSLFFDLITQVSDHTKAEKIAAEIFTPTEKTMIAKRIACFYLLMQNIPSEQIAKTIKYSTSTVAYWKRIFDNSENIKQFLSIRIRDQKIKAIFEDVVVELLYGGLRKGSNWTEDKRIYQRRKQKINDPL